MGCMIMVSLVSSFGLFQCKLYSWIGRAIDQEYRPYSNFGMHLFYSPIWHCVSLTDCACKSNWKRWCSGYWWGIKYPLRSLNTTLRRVGHILLEQTAQKQESHQKIKNRDIIMPYTSSWRYQYSIQRSSKWKLWVLLTMLPNILIPIKV